MKSTRAVTWIGGPEGHVRLLDQTRLPTEIVHRDCKTAEEVWEAIRSLRVRGAPAIGVAAAYGVVLGARAGKDVNKVCDYLATARPTAVNLFWALERMRRVTRKNDLIGDLLRAAHATFEEDLAMCRAIGEIGAKLIGDNFGVLTHCNAGALATSDYGTALAGMFVASEQGRRFHVIVDET